MFYDRSKARKCLVKADGRFCNASVRICPLDDQVISKLFVHPRLGHFPPFRKHDGPLDGNLEAS